MLRNSITRRIVLTANKKFFLVSENKWQSIKPNIVIQEKRAESSLHIFENFCSILNGANVNYWITNGTLLGIIRDGKLISWDSDADFIMANINFSTIEKIIKKLEENDYTIVVSFGTIYMKINAFKDDFKCSISQVRAFGNFYFDSMWYLKKTWIGKPRLLRFAKEININVKIPEHPKTILSKFYRNWNIPIQSEDPSDYILYETLIKDPLRSFLRIINLIPSVKDIRTFSLLKRMTVESSKKKG